MISGNVPLSNWFSLFRNRQISRRCSSENGRYFSPHRNPRDLVHSNRNNIPLRSDWAMGAPLPWSSTLHASPINHKSPISISSPSNLIYYYSKRSRVNHSSPRRCAVCAQNSNSPRSKSTISDAPSSKPAVLGDCQGNEVARVSSTPIRRRNNGILSLMSLFDKRSLWRRIFFASKKVRSIILLNVVTIVYGELTFLSGLLLMFWINGMNEKKKECGDFVLVSCYYIILIWDPCLSGSQLSHIFGLGLCCLLYTWSLQLETFPLYTKVLQFPSFFYNKELV